MKYDYNIQPTDSIDIIDASDRKKVKNASKAIDPQHCQMYVVAKLESKGLVEFGATKMLKPKIHMSKAANEIRRLHRVHPPCLEWTKEADNAFYA